ncbi:MAG: peptide-binding protein [Phycisphaeraceae bacterium]
MENRFGFRDFVFCVMLVAFIVTVVLAMLQMQNIERRLVNIDEALRNQTRDLTRIDDRLRRGVPAVEGNPHSTGGAEGANYEQGDVDPFEKLRAVKQRDDYAQGDRLMQVFAQPPDRLTPIISTDAYSSIIQSYVLETLADRDPDTLEWTPLIAREWEIIDNSEQWQAYVDDRLGEPVTEEQIRAEPEFAELEGDEAAQADYIERRLEEGMRQQEIVRGEDVPPAVTVRFRIREGVRFSDGEPLDADDVVFSYNWIMNPEVEAIRARVYMEQVMAVEKLGEHEVAFHFREPYFKAFEIAAGMEILPEHFYSDYSPSAFNRHPALLMGSGPYRLPNPVGRRPQPGVPIEIVRNERYWGEQPGFDRLVWRIVEQESSREQAFLNREIDAFPATPEQYDRLQANVEVRERSQSFEYLSPAAGYSYIGWNQQRQGEATPFADERVRRAMTMLLDRERIAEEISLGYAQVVSGPFSPLGQQTNPQIEPWPYDTAEARELLREAGYEDRNGDGVLEGPDGKPFAFTLNYPAGSEYTEQISMFVGDSYRRAGIDITVQPLEWQVLLERLKNTRDFDAVTLGWSGTLESDPYQIFHSSMIPPPGDNATSYANPELDRLIEDARMTTDEDERMAMWHEVHRILHEDQPYTFLLARQSLLFYDERIQNIERTQIGLTPATEWYVPAEMQRR